MENLAFDCLRILVSLSIPQSSQTHLTSDGFVKNMDALEPTQQKSWLQAFSEATSSINRLIMHLLSSYLPP